MSGVAFTKMHGLGNHYVYVNGFKERVADPASLARAVSDPYLGVGADGLILILPPPRGGRPLIPASCSHLSRPAPARSPAVRRAAAWYGSGWPPGSAGCSLPA